MTGTCYRCFGKMDQPECYHPGDTGRTVPMREITSNLLRGALRWIRDVIMVEP